MKSSDAVTPNSHVYYCNQCKKIFDNLEDLLFVEDDNARGFCSESCIEKFYQHLVDFFERRDKLYRKTLSLRNEECLGLVGKPKLMAMALSSPHEVWHTQNSIGEEYFCFIRKIVDKSVGAFNLIVLCMVYDNKPSFIICATATKDERLTENYREGTLLDDPKILLSDRGEVKDSFQTIEVDEEFMEAVELKKSQILANLLEERSPSDIPFEKFEMYDDHIESTLREPDEVYEKKDDEGDTILTYVKAHELNSISFYYFCVCMRYDKITREGEDTILPIITFPTTDGELYDKYRDGDKISGGLKN